MVASCRFLTCSSCCTSFTCYPHSSSPVGSALQERKLSVPAGRFVEGSSFRCSLSGSGPPHQYQLQLCLLLATPGPSCAPTAFGAALAANFAAACASPAACTTSLAAASAILAPLLPIFVQRLVPPALHDGGAFGLRCAPFLCLLVQHCPHQLIPRQEGRIRLRLAGRACMERGHKTSQCTFEEKNRAGMHMGRPS